MLRGSSHAIPDPSTGREIPRAGRQPRRWLTAAFVVGLVLATLVGAHAWLNSESVLQRLRTEAERALSEQTEVVSLEGRVRVDWLGRVVLDPVVIPARSAGRPPVVRIETALARPSWLELLRGRAALASVELRQVRVEAGPGGEELIHLVERLGASHPTPAPRRTSSASIPAIEVHDLVLVLRETGSASVAAEFGPLDCQISTASVPDGRRLEALLMLPGEGRGRLSLSRQRGITSLRATLELESLPLLPEHLAVRLPFAIADGKATLRIEAGGLTTSGTGTARLDMDLDRLVLDGKRLASEPIGPMRLSLRGRLQWDWQSRKLSLKDAELAVGNGGQVRAQVEAEVTQRPETRVAISARVDGLGYASALAALPAPLIPPAGAPQLDGPISGRFSLTGASHHPEEWRLDASLDLSGLKREARALDPHFLTGTFTYHPAESKREIRVGPENTDFVRLAELPPHVVRAVTTSEDAGFFSHQGFDFDELRNAFVESAEAGRLVRGGSTISQQLAKNLFLSGERTLARKVREALLTVALEASLGKSRMLEIYLNIVEWGPGIYGLGEAARHYFGKDPRALTPREAAFLATIIPNPVRYHTYYERGSLTDNWNARVDDLLRKMRDAGQLADEQLTQALAEPLVFDRG